MKIGLLLTGLHYKENTPIDFRYYVQNIKNYIYCLGTIETFVITNHSNIINEIVDYYNPVEIVIIEDTLNHRISKIIKGLEIIQKYQYEYICITRFDIYFLKKIVLNYDMLNIFSNLEKINHYDDNFYFFPFKYLNTFINIFKSIQHTNNPGEAHIIIYQYI